MAAFGAEAMTHPEVALCFLAGVVSSMGSGNGPNDPKTIVRGVKVNSVFRELLREMKLRQLAGGL